MFDKDKACTLTYSKVETTPSHTYYYFPNGYGASVISNGYGSSDGLFELGLLKGDNLFYIEDTMFADVIGYLTSGQVMDLLQNISQWKEVF